LAGLDYQALEPDEERKLYSEVTDLYLIVKDDSLRWMTKEGTVLLTPFEAAMEEKMKAAAAQQRAEQEKQRAEQEKQRAEQEKQRAEQEKQRAEQEKQRAEQEKQRAEQAERLLEEYRRRFGELG
jgi:septal ring factor EnvC (AmiA/AmiB activator)